MPGAGRRWQGGAQPAASLLQMLPQPQPLPLPPSTAQCLISSPATAVHWAAAWHGCVCAGRHLASPLPLQTAAVLPVEAEARGPVGETGQLPPARSPESWRTDTAAMHCDFESAGLLARQLS